MSKIRKSTFTITTKQKDKQDKKNTEMQVYRKLPSEMKEKVEKYLFNHSLDTDPTFEENKLRFLWLLDFRSRYTMFKYQLLEAYNRLFWSHVHIYNHIKTPIHSISVFETKKPSLYDRLPEYLIFSIIEKSVFYMRIPSKSNIKKWLKFRI